MKTLESVKLRYRDSKSDKVYEIDLVVDGSDHFVLFRYGKYGGKLREGKKTETRVAKKKAYAIFHALKKEKIKKGYKEVLDIPDAQIVRNLLDKHSIKYNAKTDVDLDTLEGSMSDNIGLYLSQLIPQRTFIYPTTDGGVHGVIEQVYLGVFRDIEHACCEDIKFTDLSCVVSDCSIVISGKYSDTSFSWEFDSDREDKFHTLIDGLAIDISGGGFLPSADDVYTYGFFLPVTFITEIHELGVRVYEKEDTCDVDYFKGKHVSFAVFKESERFVLDEWVESMEDFGDAKAQYVIDDKTDLIIYGDLDYPDVATLNDPEMLETAQKSGIRMMTFFEFQDIEFED